MKKTIILAMLVLLIPVVFAFTGSSANYGIVANLGLAEVQEQESETYSVEGAAANLPVGGFEGTTYQVFIGPSYLVDEDGDGVANEVDKCGSNIPVNPWFAEQELKPNHYDSSNMLDLAPTHGCSCAQILYCKPGDNPGEYRFGCSEGTKNIWESQDPDSWALDCQIDGVVAMQGMSKPLLENTDDDWAPDIIDGDNDNDGVPDNQDTMTEDSDLPGDPDYGIPDWHPSSKHKQ
ncbi:hypothetical protein KY348_02535 [Candidatus Woesearchaeota archaeon]|nr:hypothetical protein [Candidatus Woesearchaeota archaeon]